MYLKEAPWPSAQSEIKTINAYKTPRDKVQCILRMCSTIMNLLSLANEDSVPGADDFVPVLVFVLIRVSLELFGVAGRVEAGLTLNERPMSPMGAFVPSVPCSRGPRQHSD